MVSQFKNQVPEDFNLEAAAQQISYNDRRINALNAAMLEPKTFLEAHGETELEAQILRAIVHSRYWRKDLAQIARSYQIPFDEVELIAKRICRERGLDLEQLEFNAMVKQVKAVEEIPDAGFREWRLQAVAKQYKRSKRELMEAYNKALIHQAAIVPMTLKQLKESITQATEWTVQGWIPAGVTVLLHGHGGTAKTLFFYEMATAIANGKAWNGYPTKQGEVLILQSDEPKPVTEDRLEALNVAEDDPMIQVYRGWQVEAMPQLEAYLKSRHEANSPVRFVLVDSITSTNRNTMISENDVEYARPILQLADLAERYGATIAIVHHSNADGNSRGTKAIHNSVSEVWAFSILNELTGERLLRVQKNRLGRPPGRYKFDFDPNGYRFTYTGEEGSDGANDTHQKRIELWLNEEAQRSKPYATEEIAHYLNIPDGAARRALVELWSKGIILRKRKTQGRGGGYLYHAGELLSDVKLDRSRNTDRVSDRVCDLDGVRDIAELDHSIGKIDENLTNENDEVSVLSDRVIEFGCNTDEIKESKLDRQLDRPPVIDTELDRRSSSDRVPEVGDYVLAKATSVLYRHQSDKLPWQKVDRKYRDKSMIPVEVIDEDLFFELIDRSKVLAIRGDRVTVRNQSTGRTSTFRLSDVSVLEKADDAE